jgi:glyoxylase-like metal-dependent hydrolase (beta-lactamase superfamily II)
MLPNLQLHFPTRTFDGRLEFQGSRRRAELITLGKGHSDGDCFLLLAEDKTIFMGDLGFFRCHPFMGNCDPTAWIEQLEIMEQMDIQTFIPGHGPLGTKADIALQKRYIKVLEEMVVSVVTTGGSLDDALKQSFPESLESWLSSGTTRFESNVRFLFERLAEEHRE